MLAITHYGYALRLNDCSAASAWWTWRVTLQIVLKLVKPLKQLKLLKVLKCVKTVKPVLTDEQFVKTF